MTSVDLTSAMTASPLGAPPVRFEPREIAETNSKTPTAMTTSAMTFPSFSDLTVALIFVAGRRVHYNHIGSTLDPGNGVACE